MSPEDPIVNPGRRIEGRLNPSLWNNWLGFAGDVASFLDSEEYYYDQLTGERKESKKKTHLPLILSRIPKLPEYWQDNTNYTENENIYIRFINEAKSLCLRLRQLVDNGKNENDHEVISLVEDLKRKIIEVNEFLFGESCTFF